MDSGGQGQRLCEPSFLVSRSALSRGARGGNCAVRFALLNFFHEGGATLLGGDFVPLEMNRQRILLVPACVFRRLQHGAPLLLQLLELALHLQSAVLFQVLLLAQAAHSSLQIRHSTLSAGFAAQDHLQTQQHLSECGAFSNCGEVAPKGAIEESRGSLTCAAFSPSSVRARPPRLSVPMPSSLARKPSSQAWASAAWLEKACSSLESE